MKSPRVMALVMTVLGIAGAALLVALLLHHDVSDIAGAVAAAGWGVVAVVVFHSVPLFLDVFNWRVLFPPQHRLPFRSLLWMRWLGDSVSTLLPVAQIGGDLLRIQLAGRRIPVSIAAATVVLTVTVSVLTQIVFTLTGLALLAIFHGGSNLAGPTLLATVIATVVVSVFFFVQRIGLFRMFGLLAAKLTRVSGCDRLLQHCETLDDDIRALYARRRAVLVSCLWTMGVWATCAVEVWIALRALGRPVGYIDAYILESMTQGVRSAMFLVPGALGVQEGGYLIVGAALGIPGETAMALAMIRRVRELAWSAPGVIAWQITEGWRRWRPASASAYALSENPARKAP